MAGDFRRQAAGLALEPLHDLVKTRVVAADGGQLPAHPSVLGARIAPLLEPVGEDPIGVGIMPPVADGEQEVLFPHDPSRLRCRAANDRSRESDYAG